MKGDIITLYHPGDGVTASSNSSRYKGIKDFTDNQNGTITFNTKKFGKITTPLPWRLSVGVELGEEEQVAPLAAPARAGNRQNHW